MICHKCKAEVIEKVSQKTGTKYFANPGKVPNQFGFLHSETCNKKKSEIKLPKPRPLSEFSMSDAIAEAEEATKDSKTKFTSEDIRAMAVSIYIQRNKKW